MTPLAMIAEWRKGCSCAGPNNPVSCIECTVALIEALEARLSELATVQVQPGAESHP